jgi:hypothetical protein
MNSKIRDQIILALDELEKTQGLHSDLQNKIALELDIINAKDRIGITSDEMVWAESQRRYLEELIDLLDE